MGMAAEHESETRMRRLSIGLRCVRKKNRSRLFRNVLPGALVILKAIEVRVFDASDIELVTPALHLDGFIDQESEPQRFHCGDHVDRVVIAEHCIGLTANERAQASHALKRCLMGSEGPRAVITG